MAFNIPTVDEWVKECDQVIRDLNAAITSLNIIRRELPAAKDEVVRIKSEYLADLDGQDEQQRTARLTRILNQDDAYLTARQQLRDYQHAERDAQRKVRILEERCSYYMAILQFAAKHRPARKQPDPDGGKAG